VAFYVLNEISPPPNGKFSKKNLHRALTIIITETITITETMLTTETIAFSCGFGLCIHSLIHNCDEMMTRFVKHSIIPRTPPPNDQMVI